MSQFQILPTEVRTTKHNELVQHFVNWTIDLAREKGTHGMLNHGKIATDAQEAVAGDNSRFHSGKIVLTSLLRVFARSTRSGWVRTSRASNRRNISGMTYSQHLPRRRSPDTQRKPSDLAVHSSARRRPRR